MESSGGRLMNFYQHHIGDFNNATRHLSRIERSIYRDLLELYYDSEKPLTSDFDRLARRCIVDDNDCSAMLDVLNEFFVLMEDGYHNFRADREIAAYKRMAEGGKRGAEKRWGKGVNSLPIATSLPPHAKANANHEPVTMNHEPVTIVKKAPSKLVKPTIHELITEFGNRVTDSQTQAEKFLAYYESNGWKIGKNPMKSWRATVTTWVTRSKENANHGISAITGFSTPGCAGKISTVDRNGLAADNYRRKIALQYAEEDQHNGHFVGAPGSDLRG
jgi:uncharacterized protein YdaU (DUF1376 family)